MGFQVGGNITHTSQSSKAVFLPADRSWLSDTLPEQNQLVSSGQFSNPLEEETREENCLLLDKIIFVFLQKH